MFGRKLLMIMAVVVAAMVITAAESEYFPRAHLEGYAGAKSHNLTIGYRQPGDRLVLSQNVVKKSAWMRVVTVEKNITLPNPRYTITKVEVIDQKTDGTGANVNVLSGGQGKKFIKLAFKSQRGHGINFIINLFARY